MSLRSCCMFDRKPSQARWSIKLVNTTFSGGGSLREPSCSGANIATTSSAMSGRRDRCIVTTITSSTTTSVHQIRCSQDCSTISLSLPLSLRVTCATIDTFRSCACPWSVQFHHFVHRQLWLRGTYFRRFRNYNRHQSNFVLALLVGWRTVGWAIAVIRGPSYLM